MTPGRLSCDQNRLHCSGSDRYTLTVSLHLEVDLHASVICPA